MIPTILTENEISGWASPQRINGWADLTDHITGSTIFRSTSTTSHTEHYISSTRFETIDLRELIDSQRMEEGANITHFY